MEQGDRKGHPQYHLNKYSDVEFEYSRTPTRGYPTTQRSYLRAPHVCIVG